MFCLQKKGKNHPDKEKYLQVAGKDHCGSEDNIFSDTHDAICRSIPDRNGLDESRSLQDNKKDGQQQY